MVSGHSKEGLMHGLQWCALMDPNKNTYPGPSRNTRNSLGGAQSQLLPLEKFFISASLTELTASHCHRTYYIFLAGPCSLPQDHFLSLPLGNRLRVLVGVTPAFPALPPGPAASAGQPSWGLQVSLQNVAPRQCSQHKKAVMEASPQHMVLQESGWFLMVVL